MADVLENGEFWLPPQFLADDDDDYGVNKSPKSLLPSGFESFGFVSDPSSTEAESDEEDYLDGLTRQMARYTLEDDFFGRNENNEEPNCAFNSSEVKRSSGFSYTNQKSGATTQFQQSQVMKEHNPQIWGDKNPRHVVLQNNVSGCNNNNNNIRSLGFAWPPLQHQSKQQNGSGMRAVFMGNPNNKSGCAGTGVFLPRHIGTATATAQPRKKKVCSTVLVPARVVEALNLNLDEINARVRPRVKPSVATDNGAVSRLRSGGGNDFANPKQRKFRAEQRISHEIQLPQEWTY